MNELQKKSGVICLGGGGMKNTLSYGKRKNYEQCRLEIVSFENEDILTTSGELEPKDNLGGWEDVWNNINFKGWD